MENGIDETVELETVVGEEEEEEGGNGEEDGATESEVEGKDVDRTGEADR